jgi:hypothetical protein
VCVKNKTKINKMLKLEELTNNSCWYIDPLQVQDFVTNGNLLDYKFCNIELSKIHRLGKMEGEKKFLKLKETISYKFLSNQSQQQVFDEYIKYCKKTNTFIDYHSPQIFISLYKKILKDGYDIKKGIIIVDQNNTICDGLHRACILLFIHGENFKIPVLKFKLKSSRLDKVPFLIPIYKFFDYFRKKLKRCFNG